MASRREPQKQNPLSSWTPKTKTYLVVKKTTGTKARTKKNLSRHEPPKKIQSTKWKNGISTFSVKKNPKHEMKKSVTEE